MTAITERLRFCWESAKVAGLLVSGCVAWAMGAVISDICPYLLPVLSTLPLFDAWMHISGVRWLTKDWEDLHACTSIIILEPKLGPFCLTTGEMQSYLQIGRKTISWYFPISFFFFGYVFLEAGLVFVVASTWPCFVQVFMTFLFINVRLQTNCTFFWAISNMWCCALGWLWSVVLAATLIRFLGFVVLVRLAKFKSMNHCTMNLSLCE